MCKKCQPTRKISFCSELTSLNFWIVYPSQNAGCHSFSRQKTLTTDYSKVWYAFGAVGRCAFTWLPNFLRWVVDHIFLPMVLRCARFAPGPPLSSLIFVCFSIWTLQSTQNNADTLAISWNKNVTSQTVGQSAYFDELISPSSITAGYKNFS